MDCTTLALRLLLAHVLADFYLQPARWIDDRRARGTRSPWLHVHGLLHGAFAWIALGDAACWPWAVAIAVSHVVIDRVKARCDRQGKSAAWFVIDQSLHVCVLGVATHFVAPSGLAVPSGSMAPGTRLLAVVETALAISRPVGFFIQAFTVRWEVHLGDRTDNLPGAGKWIGVVERLLILLFVQIGSMEAVGFLLAAKSVFRFGDLRDATDRRLLRGDWS